MIRAHHLQLHYLLGVGIIVLILFHHHTAHGFELFRSKNKNVQEGNELLKKEDYGQAVERYNAAAKQLPNRGEVHLNRGLALMRNGDEKQVDQAMQALTLAKDSNASPAVRARAYFNLGNTFFQKNDYDEAIKNYKKSLMLSPGDRNVAWNLEVARLRKKQKEEQDKQNQDKQDQDKQDQDKQDQDEQDQDKQDQEKQEQGDQGKQDQDKQDQDTQDQDKQEQPKPKDDEEKSSEQEEKPQPKPQQQDQQEIERILDALDQQDDDLTKNKAKQRAVVPRRGVKDW